jgi:hypothetical protein
MDSLTVATLFLTVRAQNQMPAVLVLFWPESLNLVLKSSLFLFIAVPDDFAYNFTCILSLFSSFSFSLILVMARGARAGAPEPNSMYIFAHFHRF